jgi:hypothetical protein
MLPSHEISHPALTIAPAMGLGLHVAPCISMIACKQHTGANHHT